MTQDDRWQRQYDMLMDFMRRNHRRPSKYKAEEHLMLNWLRRHIKLHAKGMVPPERLDRLNQLLDVADQVQRVNQYQ